MDEAPLVIAIRFPYGGIEHADFIRLYDAVERLANQMVPKVATAEWSIMHGIDQPDVRTLPSASPAEMERLRLVMEEYARGLGRLITLPDSEPVFLEAKTIPWLGPPLLPEQKMMLEMRNAGFRLTGDEPEDNDTVEIETVPPPVEIG